MNKKAIGLVLSGLIVGSSVTAFAAGGRQIEVFDNVKKVVVNKINKPFTKGEEPFTYNGRTYVPLRYVSEALGENVEWDGKTGTVYIGETNNKNAHYWGKDIFYMNWDARYVGTEFSYSYNESDRTLKDNLNNEYSNYLRLKTDNGYKGFSRGLLEFPLSGQYKKFNAIVSPTSKYLSARGSVALNIYLDGKHVSKTVVPAGSMPQNLSIDLNGANKIGFEIIAEKEAGGNRNFEIGVFNGEFIKK